MLYFTRRGRDVKLALLDARDVLGFIDGLMELEAEASTALLLRAKEAAFGDGPVPADQRARWDAMADTGASDAELNRLDQLFCEDPDRLGERCAKFAKAHELFG